MIFPTYRSYKIHYDINSKITTYFGFDKDGLNSVECIFAQNKDKEYYKTCKETKN